MLEALAWFVVLVLVGPPLVLAAGGALALVAALLPGSPRRIWQTFHCPWARRTVTAEFLAAEGARHPSEVAACSAFAVPTRVACQKHCRDVADLDWGLSRGLFPRWALTAGGPVVWPDTGARLPSR
jgi:hypothetical protein